LRRDKGVTRRDRACRERRSVGAWDRGAGEAEEEEENEEDEQNILRGEGAGGGVTRDKHAFTEGFAIFEA
jgi:hypothetical protein